MEVYRLAPNTTYEFRIWANNELGSGEVVTTNVTTLPETKEEGESATTTTIHSNHRDLRLY